ncbi:MAG: Hsp70 family protein, partial [bacterium]|nr:Hsp70 family protein [bacterium]
KAEIETRNQADALVYTTEKTLSDNKDKLPAEDVKKVEEALAACKKALEEKNTESIKSTTEALTQASHKLAEIMYKQASAAGAQGKPEQPGDGSQGGGETKEAKKDEKVVDAEFEENPPK